MGIAALHAHFKTWYELMYNDDDGYICQESKKRTHAHVTLRKSSG